MSDPQQPANGIDHDDADEIIVNGVSGSTGEYLVPPLTEDQVAAMASGEPIPESVKAELRSRVEMLAVEDFGFLGPEEELENLAKCGWGIIFADDDPRREAILQQLEPLLNEREAEAMDLYKVFQNDTGVKSKQSKLKWMADRKVAAGSEDWKKVPYYLLIVGAPERISYNFQYELGVAHAVGRIQFDDLEDYGHYARSVVKSMKGESQRKRELTFFAPRNNLDKATRLSHDRLVTPLVQAYGDDAAWEVDELLGSAAMRDALLARFQRDPGPGLLFSASHGVGFGTDDDRQLGSQGALLCQDWPGRFSGALKEDHYLAASDVPADANLGGLIAFFFACYGGGTPQYDGFVKDSGRLFQEIARKPFVARLPQKLLAHPNGGAQAVVGHIDRAFAYSFLWPNAGDQIGIFVESLKSLTEGARVGHAVEAFSSRWAELSTAITNDIEQPDPLRMPKRELGGLWTASNDSRSYVIFGDPAARLAVPDPD